MPAVNVRRRSSTLPIVFAVLFLGLLLAVAGVLAYLYAGNSIPVPFSDPPRTFSFAQKEAPRVETVPAGSVAVPASARAIPAFRAVTLEDLWDAQRNRVNPLYVPEKDRAAVLESVDLVVGRVLKHDKPANRPFVEGDFLPKGTRPGPAAGIPPGMRALLVKVDQVSGLYGLNPGDRFDLVATMPVDGDPSDELKRLGGVHASQMALEASLGNIGKQATVNVIVQNGIVVEAVKTIEIPTAAGALHGGRGDRTKPVQVARLAVSLAEVAALNEALAVSAQLSAVSRSGHPDDDPNSLTPSSRPWSPFDGDGEGENGGSTGGGMKFVEQVKGSKRELVPVPSDSNTKKGD